MGWHHGINRISRDHDPVKDKPVKEKRGNLMLFIDDTDVMFLFRFETGRDAFIKCEVPIQVFIKAGGKRIVGWIKLSAVEMSTLHG